MKELKIATGVETYKLNDSVEVSFNPTDAAFGEKLFNAFDTLDKRQESYKAEVGKAEGKRELFDVVRKLDGEMREIINDVFEFDVCSGLFGALNVYALAGGLPLWANLLLAIMDEMDETVMREKKAMNPRIAKYTKKYHR
jgi:hypothetical protein|nr:MAG TPA: hypothetical protein [Caudoviricetes sp.]